MKKLTTEIIALCDYAYMSHDKQLSIVGIGDEWHVAKLPFTIPTLYFVVCLMGSSFSNHSVKVKGAGFKKTMKDIALSENGKFNLIIKMSNLEFKKYGKYEFSVMEGKEKIASTSLEIIKEQVEERVVN